MTEMRSGLKKKTEVLEEIILRKKDNIVYVDFALYSMVNAIDLWYEKHYQNDPWSLMKKAHMFHTIRFYDRNRFKDHNTIGRQRDAYLEEIDLYVQMRRDD